MSDNEKMITAYDNALLGILQNEGKLEAFLDVIFGFLCRRTDFFLTMKSETGKYGFPPGVAEKMVYSVRVIFYINSTFCANVISLKQKCTSNRK